MTSLRVRFVSSIEQTRDGSIYCVGLRGVRASQGVPAILPDAARAGRVRGVDAELANPLTAAYRPVGLLRHVFACRIPYFTESASHAPYAADASAGPITRNSATSYGCSSWNRLSSEIGRAHV